MHTAGDGFVCVWECGNYTALSARAESLGGLWNFPVKYLMNGTLLNGPQAVYGKLPAFVLRRRGGLGAMLRGCWRDFCNDFGGEV